MTSLYKTPASKARKWALGTIILIAISNISLISSKGIDEFLVRTLVIGGIVAGIVFLVIWAIISFKKKSDE